MNFKRLLLSLILLYANLVFAFQTSLTPDNEFILNIPEPSGIACNFNNGTLYTHNDGLNSHIYHITTRGEVLDSLLIGGDDFEGIAFNATFDTLFVVEEFVSRVSKFLTDGTFTDFINVNVENNILNGLEGITVNPENGHIFLVKEKDSPSLLELAADGTEIRRLTLSFLGTGDASGITIHPQWNTLFILSHENQAIYETTLSGKFLRYWMIPVEKAEGISFNAALDSIYIVDDLYNTLYVFAFNEQPYVHSLYINELMAGNNTTLSDNNGDYDDWIELYNPNDYSIDVAGLSLADNYNRIGLWQIPTGFSDQTTIAPKGYLVLWADEEVSQGPLHINIKLSKNGEQIALYNDLLLLDSVRFPLQTDDISYGRKSDGDTSWEFFNPSSPNNSNEQGSVVLALDNNPGPRVLTYQLKQNYPNPFNPVTKINYSVGAYGNVPQRVNLSVYNILGKKVATLVSARQQPGTYSLTFDASDLPSGLYFYILQSGDFISTKKMLLLK